MYVSVCFPMHLNLHFMWVFLTNTKSSLWTVIWCLKNHYPFVEKKFPLFLTLHSKDIYLGSVIEHCVFQKVWLTRHNIILLFKSPKENWKAINIYSKCPTLFLNMNLYIDKFLWDSGFPVIPPIHLPQDICIFSITVMSWT